LDYINGRFNHDDMKRMVCWVSLFFDRLKWRLWVHQDETLERRWCMNHVLYTWSVLFKGTTWVRHYLSDIRSCYSSKLDFPQNIWRNKSNHGLTKWRNLFGSSMILFVFNYVITIIIIVVVEIMLNYVVEIVVVQLSCRYY
jgi:hypothetical protein